MTFWVCMTNLMDEVCSGSERSHDLPKAMEMTNYRVGLQTQVQIQSPEPERRCRPTSQTLQRFHFVLSSLASKKRWSFFHCVSLFHVENYTKVVSYKKRLSSNHFWGSSPQAYEVLEESNSLNSNTRFVSSMSYLTWCYLTSRNPTFLISSEGDYMTDAPNS